MAEVRFEQLVDVNMARDSDSAWVSHFKKLSFLMESLQEDIVKASDAVQHVRTEANSVRMEERFVKAKQEVDRFVSGSSTFCQHISTLLNVALPEPTPISASITLASSSSPTSADLPLFIQHAGRAPPVPQNASPSTSTSPSVVDLHGRDINDANIATKVLIHLEPSITELMLDKNHIGADGAMILLEHLSKYCPNLSHVNMWRNRLGSDGARALGAILLRPDCRLAHLDINQNDIGDDGAIFLGTALEFCVSLEYLDISFNSITDIGAQAVLDGLSRASSSNLKFLKLSGNTLSLALARQFVEFARTHESMVSLMLGSQADNPNMDDALISDLRRICHPRSDAYYQELRRLDEEKKKEAERPRLKAIDSAPAAEVYRPRRPKFKEKQPVTSKLARESDSSARLVQQMISLDESIGFGELEGNPEVPGSSSSSSPLLEESDYYQLIRIIQVLKAGKATTWLKKSLLAKAFKLGVYSASVPNVNLTFDEFIENARASGVVELREERDDKRSKLRTAVTLTAGWSSFSVPLPKALLADDLPGSYWAAFIDFCRKKASTSHRKIPKLVASFKTHAGKALQAASDPQVHKIIDVGIYCGIFARQASSSKYGVNLNEKDWPVDFQSCPAIPK